MKYFKINQITNNHVVVFSTSHHSPTEQLDSIAKELLKKQFKGVVIFDMLLSNGNTKQRYFESMFNGTNFLNESFKNICEQSLELKDISHKFYSKNISLVDKSHILPKSTKFLIKKGVSCI